MQTANTPLPTMYQAWREFLANTGAIIERERVEHFGQPEEERRMAESRDILVDLSHLALLQARGPDAQSFLQGQLSNDIRQVSATQAQISAYCNPKGRMFAIFQIFQRDDSYYLQLPAALADATLKRLRMFILRSRLTLGHAPDELMRIGLSGPNAPRLIEETTGLLPSTANETYSGDDITVLRLTGPLPRFELIAPRQRMETIWTSLARHAAPTGAGPWAWLEIKAGIPTVLPGTVEEFVPQMANLELLEGVNFKKGCYPGQEIVARMHYLGRLKQRMFLAHVENDSKPQPGMPVFAPDLPGQSAGTVVSAEPAPAGGYDLLAVIQLSSVQRGEIRLAAEQGPPLKLSDLPYVTVAQLANPLP
jgi:folate-binding protein YgfZ